ncbi:hypothetical protein TNCV_2555421 [Trichonephila clavipes]|nr:hypothetical protein TNCV_2555421 [Trichonephila clavipes]
MRNGLRADVTEMALDAYHRSQERTEAKFGGEDLCAWARNWRRSGQDRLLTPTRNCPLWKIESSTDSILDTVGRGGASFPLPNQLHRTKNVVVLKIAVRRPTVRMASFMQQRCDVLVDRTVTKKPTRIMSSRAEQRDIDGPFILNRNRAMKDAIWPITP